MTEKTIKKRQKLKELSLQAQELAQLEAEKTQNPFIVMLTVNAKLKMFIYERKDFNTFRGWKKEGRKVKKGETAFLFWGRPINKDASNKEELHNTEDADNESIFFPLSFLFHKDQTEEIKKE